MNTTAWVAAESFAVLVAVLTAALTALSIGATAIDFGSISASMVCASAALAAVATAAPSNMMRGSKASMWWRMALRASAAGSLVWALLLERLPLRRVCSPTATKDWVNSFHRVLKTWFIGFSLGGGLRPGS